MQKFITEIINLILRRNYGVEIIGRWNECTIKNTKIISFWE